MKNQLKISKQNVSFIAFSETLSLTQNPGYYRDMDKHLKSLEKLFQSTKLEQIIFMMPCGSDEVPLFDHIENDSWNSTF